MASISSTLERIKQDLEPFLPRAVITGACEQAGHTWREREYGPVRTIHLFILQVLCFNTAMNHLRFLAKEVVKAPAYCRARMRLPLAVLQQFHPAIEKDVFDALSLRGSLNARNTLGGTAPAQVKAQIARHRRPERRDRPTDRQLLAGSDWFTIWNLKGLYRIFFLTRCSREHKPIRPTGSANSSNVAAPTKASRSLLIDAVEQMHLAVDSTENPEHILVFGNGRGGIKRRC